MDLIKYGENVIHLMIIITRSAQNISSFILTLIGRPCLATVSFLAQEIELYKEKIHTNLSRNKGNYAPKRTATCS